MRTHRSEISQHATMKHNKTEILTKLCQKNRISTVAQGFSQVCGNFFAVLYTVICQAFWGNSKNDVAMAECRHQDTFRDGTSYKVFYITLVSAKNYFIEIHQCVVCSICRMVVKSALPQFAVNCPLSMFLCKFIYFFLMVSLPC